MIDHVAIDPGVSGGLAYFSEEAGGVVAEPMPGTSMDLIEILVRLRAAKISRCVVEKLPRFVPMGKSKRGIPAAKASVMFENYGIIQGAALALGYRLEKVDPKVWQSALSLGAKNSNPRWKQHLKGRAQELFPSAKVTLKTADALLIWEYGSGLVRPHLTSRTA